jgi:hypothetical protein
MPFCQGVCYRQASQLWSTRFTATDRSSQSFGEGGILCLLGDAVHTGTGILS